MNLRFRDAALIKLILITFLMAFATVMSSRLVDGQFAVQEPKQKVFYSKYGGGWLTVGRANTKDDPDPWNASYTYIKTACRPTVTKRGDYYEINFETASLPAPDLGPEK